MSHMKQDGRCRSLQKPAVDPLWDERRAHDQVELELGSEWDDENPTLLADLAVGQALIIDWSEAEPTAYIEDIIPCQTCGEALSESRLAFMSLRSPDCPTCGRPAKA